MIIIKDIRVASPVIGIRLPKNKQIQIARQIEKFLLREYSIVVEVKVK